MTTVSEYHVYEHPLLPPKLVKNGFCWTTLVVGPAWLLFRRLWVPTLWYLAIVALAYYLNHHNLVPFNCFYLKDSGVWVATPGSGLEDWDCVTRTQIIDLAILALAQLVTAIHVNELWARDLVNRGYIHTKTVHARSNDEALAKLARTMEPQPNRE